MTKVIARLAAILGLESKDFVKGVNEAQQKSKEFKKNLKELQETTDQLKTAFGVASAAFIGFAAHAINAADEIQDLADANDTTTGRILELRHALDLSGGDASKITVLFTKFTSAINDAAQGSDNLRDSFKEVGISTKDLGILSNDQLQNKAFAGLAKIEDVVRRNALATELFGKAAKSVDFKSLADNAEKLSGHYSDQEKSIKAAADAAQKVKDVFHEIEMAALLAIKPVLDLFNKIPTEHKVEAMTKGFQALGIAMGVAFGVTAVKGVLQLAGALRTLAISNPWLLALTAAGGAAAYFGLDKLLGGGETIPEDLSPDASTGTKRNIEKSARDKKSDKYNTDLELIRQQFELRKRSAEFDEAVTKAQLNLDGQRYALTDAEYKKKLLTISIGQENAQKQLKYEEELQAARQELLRADAEEYTLAKRNYDEKVELLNQAYDLEYEIDARLNEIRQTNLDNEIARQRSWSAGWDEAFKNYQEAAERASDRGKEAFNSVVQNMESALRNFVETGKLNFKDLIGSIVKDLLYVQMRAQATSIFKMITSSFSLTGSSPNAPIEERSFSGFASGGYVDRPSIVGENGPELFIPSRPGTVIPNGSWQQMANSGGGGMTVNGPYIANMSAIDTQSATQFLASNKQTIWAAYQSANRSVPISR